MSQVLNSPIEVGVRVVALLTSLYPGRSDIARLVLLDYAILHSADFGGEASLHPQLSTRSGELGLKRQLIGEALHLMGSLGLVSRRLTGDGIYYSAGEEALPFLQSFESPYVDALRKRCSWAVAEFSAQPDEQIRLRLNAVFGRWAEEFEPLDEGFAHE